MSMNVNYECSFSTRSASSWRICPRHVNLSHAALQPLQIPHTALSLIRHIHGFSPLTLSGRNRCVPSSVTTIHITTDIVTASVVVAEMRNMIICWYFTACEMDAPPRIAPVIIPGIETRPITLDVSYVCLEGVRGGPHLCYCREHGLSKTGF